MAIALSDEHLALGMSVRGWLESHCPPSVPRALLDVEAEDLQPIWKEMAAEGWLGIHLPEEFGGQGFGLFELAVVLEETGRSLVPGPLLPTVATSTLVSESADPAVQARFLPGLIDGTSPATLSLGESALSVVERGTAGEIAVSGSLRPLLGASTASLVLAPAREVDGRPIWCLLEVPDSDQRLSVTSLSSLDPTRRVGEVTVDSVTVPADRQLRALTTDRVRQVVMCLMAAEHAGGARWCLDTASDYAKVRVQFGRPIGQFQAVKHRLADMAIRVEQMTAVAWDAALAVDSGEEDGDVALACATAGALALDGYARGATECLQILGGIGFTWEHDLHLHLKRAMADRQLMGEADDYCVGVADRAEDGARRTLAADLPAEADTVRSELAPVVAAVVATDESSRRRALVDAGLVVPHWPRPWGRDAGAVEQVVIDEVFAAAGLARPHSESGAWALPPIIASGTGEQHERWVRPTLLGELSWCQLFSEPGAGSDLAGLSTRAERGQDGWLLTGQKVWTSMARQADWGICLGAGPTPTAPKHRGITYFIVDMHSYGSGHPAPA